MVATSEVIKVISQTLKILERAAEARPKTDVNMCERRYGFMPRKSTDVLFVLLCRRTEKVRGSCMMPLQIQKKHKKSLNVSPNVKIFKMVETPANWRRQEAETKMSAGVMIDRISNEDIRETAHVRWFNNKVREELVWTWTEQKSEYICWWMLRKEMPGRRPKRRKEEQIHWWWRVRRREIIHCGDLVWNPNSWKVFLSIIFGQISLFSRYVKYLFIFIWKVPWMSL